MNLIIVHLIVASFFGINFVSLIPMSESPSGVSLGMGQSVAGSPKTALALPGSSSSLASNVKSQGDGTESGAVSGKGSNSANATSLANSLALGAKGDPKSLSSSKLSSSDDKMDSKQPGSSLKNATNASGITDDDSSSSSSKKGDAVKSKAGSKGNAGKSDVSEKPDSGSSTTPSSAGTFKPKYDEDGEPIDSFFDSIATANATTSKSTKSKSTTPSPSTTSTESSTTTSGSTSTTKSAAESKNWTSLSSSPSSLSSSSSYSSASTEKPGKDKDDSWSNLFAGSYWNKSKNKSQSDSKSSSSVSSANDGFNNDTLKVDMTSLKASPKLAKEINDIVYNTYKDSKNFIAGFIQKISQSVINIYAALTNNKKD